MATNEETLESFLDLNSSIMGNIHFIYDNTVNVALDKNSISKFEKLEFTVPNEIDQMIEVYKELNPFDDHNKIKQKRDQIIPISKNAISNLKFFIKFDYSENKEYLNQILSPLRPDMVEPNFKVNSIDDIGNLEEFVRYMHARISQPNLEYDDKYETPRYSGCTITLQKNTFSKDMTLHFGNLNNELIFSSGKVYSKHPFLNPFFRFFDGKRDVKFKANITKHDEGFIKATMPLANHTSTITFKEDDGYSMKYWGSGDYAYGTYRQRFSKLFLEGFGFKNDSCDTYGVKSILKTDDPKLINKSTRAILYLLENSFDMDISGSVLSPKDFHAHIDGLIDLEDFQENLKRGKDMYQQLESSKETLNDYYKKIELLDNPSPLEEDILMTMLLTNFPSRPENEICRRNNPKSESYDNQLELYLQNPSALGFAYYHIGNLSQREITRDGLFEFLETIDKVQCLCFDYGNFKEDDYRVKWFGPAKPWSNEAKERMKNQIDFAFNTYFEKNEINTNEAKKLLLGINNRSYNLNYLPDTWKGLRMTH